MKMLLALALAAMPGFVGKSGAGLRQAVARECAPARAAQPSFQLMARLDGQAARTWDPWCAAWVDEGAWRDWYTLAGWAPARWWESPASFEAIDLHNLRPSRVDAADARGLYPPGVGPMEQVRWDNGVFQTGVAGDIEVFTPPAEYRGDLARAYFYMAALYPTTHIAPRAWTVLTGREHPALTPYAVGLLGAWAVDDPVSPDEGARNGRVEAEQGNRNPFIDYPDLWRHLWGDRADTPFVVEGERVPLRGTYRMSDGRIDLYTPSAPPGAAWSVDGREVGSASVATADLGPGRHHLTFTHRAATGRVMIEILP